MVNNMISREIENFNTGLIEMINSFQLVAQHVPREQYVEVRNQFLTMFEEIVGGYESEHENELNDIRTIKSDLVKYLDGVIETIDESHATANVRLRLKSGNLSGTNLSNFNFNSVDLRTVDLQRAILSGADLRNVRIDYETLPNDYSEGFSKTIFHHFAVDSLAKRQPVFHPLYGITIDETTLLNSDQIDYLISINSKNVVINGLQEYLAHHRPVESSYRDAVPSPRITKSSETSKEIRPQK